MFENIPFPLDFKVHVFNITNPADVTKGSKAILKDIGPFVFE
jgi:scavenger receptor class B, member 1